jgi:hypothetical protein
VCEFYRAIYILAWIYSCSGYISNIYFLTITKLRLVLNDTDVFTSSTGKLYFLKNESQKERAKKRHVKKNRKIDSSSVSVLHFIPLSIQRTPMEQLPRFDIVVIHKYNHSPASEQVERFPITEYTAIGGGQPSGLKTVCFFYLTYRPYLACRISLSL